MNPQSNFSIPQRQNLTGILIMFVNSLQKTIRALWPILIVWIFKFDTSKLLYLGLGTITVLVLTGIFSYLQYWYFTFHIDENSQEFIIQKGVLNKTKIAIQLNKIQQVNINQSLIQRLIGVHKLEIETAGSDKKEASISAISHTLALALKNQIMHSNALETNVVEEEINTEMQSSKHIISIGLNSLLKIGFTANYLKSFALLFLVITTLIENLRQIGKEDLVGENIENYIDSSSIAKSILFVIAVVFMLILVINLVRTLIKYFNFSIAKDKNTLLISFGLIDTKNIILNPNKVQILKITQNYLQRKLDVNILQIKQASSDEHQQKAKDQIVIPGCNSSEKNEILTLVFNQLPTSEITLLPNLRKLILNSFFFIILPVGIGFLINYFGNQFSAKQFVLLVLFYSLFLGIIIYFGFKNYQLKVSKEFIIKQSGAWDIDHEIIEPYKIQAIETQQFFWQKKANIGSVTLSTAGGNISFSTGNFEEIKKLANYWLYQVETSDRNWM